jgi:putative hemolysin
MKNVWIATVVIVVALGAIIGFRLFSGDEDTWLCEDGTWVKHGNPTAEMPTSGCGDEDQATTDTTIANPASVNCKDQGGTVDIRTAEDGGQLGYCVFPDGQECEEWALLNGECTVEENR